MFEDSFRLGLYIFWFLHQTTTSWPLRIDYQSCHRHSFLVVYLLIPTSNHNCVLAVSRPHYVVYLLIPTSNHNSGTSGAFIFSLYIFWFLHQTTTFSQALRINSKLYIFWFLHQTTTSTMFVKLLIRLYIFWFLHQATTSADSW